MQAQENAARPAHDDFVAFARAVMASDDLHPLYQVLRALYRDWAETDALWFSALYQAFGDLGSTAAAFRLLPAPSSPLPAAATALQDLPCSGDRPNLRGGRVVRHLEQLQRHYREQPGSFRDWLTQGWSDDPVANYSRFWTTLKKIWGSGRLATYRWAMLLKRVHHLPIAIGNLAQAPGLEAPRVLVRLYGLAAPTPEMLDDAAVDLRDTLTSAGIPLTAWEDVATLLEKWYRLGKGHYAIGQDRARLRAEIEAPRVPAELRALLTRAWELTAAQPPNDAVQPSPGPSGHSLPIPGEGTHCSPRAQHWERGVGG